MAGLVEIGPVVVEKKIFKFCQCIFALLVIAEAYKEGNWQEIRCS